MTVDEANKIIRDAHAEITKLRAAMKEIHEYADAACEGAGEPEFSGFSWIAACSHKALNT